MNFKIVADSGRGVLSLTYYSKINKEGLMYKTNVLPIQQKELKLFAWKKFQPLNVFKLGKKSKAAVDEMESRLPLNPKFINSLKKAIEESNRKGWVPFSEIQTKLGLS